MRMTPRPSALPASTAAEAAVAGAVPAVAEAVDAVLDEDCPDAPCPLAEAAVPDEADEADDRASELAVSCTEAGVLDASGRVPLAALLARAERAFNAEFDRRLVESQFEALSIAHSRNILRHLGCGPMRASLIVAKGEVSKQAISQQIAHLERNGYVTVTPDPTDQRARMLALTEQGERAQAMVNRLFTEIEDDWIAELSKRSEHTEHLRPALLALLEMLGPIATRC